MNLKYYVMEMGNIANVIDTYDGNNAFIQEKNKKTLQFLESK
jgi:hypothetical protein